METALPPQFGRSLLVALPGHFRLVPRHFL